MPWPIYLALKQLFPTGRRFPFFTAISVLGVSLGVMVLVIVTSVMGGFGHELRKMIVQMEGEIQVKPVTSQPILEPAETLKRIQGTNGVTAATAFVAGPVMVLTEGRNPAFPLFRGIDLETVEKVTNIGRFVLIGSLKDLDDDSVILSAKVAQDLGANLGDQIQIITPLFLVNISRDEVILPRKFRIAGFFEIGHQHLDSSTIFGTLRAAQELYGMGGTVHGFYVRVQPDANELAVVANLNRALPPEVRALPWTVSWESFLWVLELEKTITAFMLLFIVIIAAFSVMSSLLISVVRKTREIGLLGALGGKSRDVALCFCTQAFIIGVAGTIVGLALGFGVIAIRQPIVDGIAKLLNREATLRQFYQFTQLPAHPIASDIIMTAVAAIVISTLAGLLPAWRAAKLKPVEALRSE
jgi:lipoprotein-releasing system permease protein